MFRDEANGLWAFASHELVQAAGRIRDVLERRGSRPDTGPLPWMIDLDGTAHRTRRRLVSGAFTAGAGPRSTSRGGGDLRRADRRRVRGGSCDVVRALAAPLPMIVIGDMLGVAPPDRARCCAWSDDLLAAER